MRAEAGRGSEASWVVAARCLATPARELSRLFGRTPVSAPDRAGTRHPDHHPRVPVTENRQAQHRRIIVMAESSPTARSFDVVARPAGLQASGLSTSSKPRIGTARTLSSTPGAKAISITAPAPPHHGGEDETSQVPGRPLRACPALRPRRTTDPTPVQDRRCCLPLDSPRRLLNYCHFRGSITQPARSLCTLRSRGHLRSTPHSIPAGGQP